MTELGILAAKLPIDDLVQIMLIALVVVVPILGKVAQWLIRHFSAPQSSEDERRERERVLNRRVVIRQSDRPVARPMPQRPASSTTTLQPRMEARPLPSPVSPESTSGEPKKKPAESLPVPEFLRNILEHVVPELAELRPTDEPRRRPAAPTRPPTQRSSSPSGKPPPVVRPVRTVQRPRPAVPLAKAPEQGSRVPDQDEVAVGSKRRVAQHAEQLGRLEAHLGHIEPHVVPRFGGLTPHIAGGSTETTSTLGRWRQLTRAELRRAIVMNEVLAPPLSIRPPDDSF